MPTRCNSRSILFQSKPNAPPIKHNFGTNPLTILYHSIANPLLIQCQSITNLIPILFQSIANPMSIHRHSCTNALSIICQSSDITVQIHCQSITKVVLLRVNRGGRLASFDSLCARCFAFLRTLPKKMMLMFFKILSKHCIIKPKAPCFTSCFRL